MKLSRYVKIYPCPEQPGKSLLFSTKRSSAIVVPDELLEAAKSGSVTGANRDTLVRLGFLVPDSEAERLEMRDVFVKANRERRIFNGVVTLNLDCNLACSYCFEDNFRGSFYMSRETADLLVDTVVRDQMEKGNDVQVCFYGGEPLLSIDLLRDIATRLGAAARANGTGFKFSMITNGTLLTKKLVEELMPIGLMGAKFTLDGPRETHDPSRPFLSGSGSYDVIAGNFADIHTLISLQLGGNFTRENYRRFPLVLDDLVERGVAPERLVRVLFAPVTGKSGQKGVTDFTSNCVCSFEPWVIEAAAYLREETVKRGFPVGKIQMSACMVEYDNDVIVNYNGDIYKCPGFMCYDELRIGTLRNGIGDYHHSHNMDGWKKDECLDCAYLPICFGGCRFLTLAREGAINDVDCRKEFFDATLERMIRLDLAARAKKKG